MAHNTQATYTIAIIFNIIVSSSSRYSTELKITN